MQNQTEKNLFLSFDVVLINQCHYSATCVKYFQTEDAYSIMNFGTSISLKSVTAERLRQCLGGIYGITMWVADDVDHTSVGTLKPYHSGVF